MRDGVSVRTRGLGCAGVVAAMCAVAIPGWAAKSSGEAGRGSLQAVAVENGRSSPAGQTQRAAAVARGPMAAQLTGILAEPALARAHWGVSVIAMDGTPLFAWEDGKLFPPASTAKLLTTAAAMALLGPGATLRTEVLARGVVSAGGELRGDLALVGVGDANLSGRILPYVPPSQRPKTPGDADAGEDADPLAPLAAMADAVVATGLRDVTGDVIGDDTAFPWEPYATGWELDDLVWGYGAPVGALAVADNELRLTVLPGARVGEPASVKLAQAAPYYVVEATATTAAPKSAAAGVEVERAPGSRALQVHGRIALGASGDVEEVAISDPAEYAAMAFKAMLEARSVTVHGRAVALHRHAVEARSFLSQVREPIAGLTGGGPPPTERAAGSVSCDTKGDVPGGCGASVPAHSGPGVSTVVAAHTSPPLEQDVVLTNKTSQNLHAELMLRRLGGAWGSDSSAAQGARVVRQFVAHAGIAKDDVVLYDGSGLSGHDLVTPRAETALLGYASRQPWFAAWKASLPVGGVDGTLYARFTHDGLAGRVFAKTGTLGEARALAGYVVCASGRTVMFALMDQSHLPGSNVDRDAMDRMVEAIAAAN